MRCKTFWSVGCLATALIFSTAFPLIGQQEKKEPATPPATPQAKAEPRDEKEQRPPDERRRGPRPEGNFQGPPPGAPGGFRLAAPGSYPPGLGPQQFGYGPPGAFPVTPEELQRTDPEMYEIEQADRDSERVAMQLAAKYRQATGEDRNAVKEQLTQEVNKHFEVRQKKRELQAKRLEAELEKIRKSIASRNESREKLVGKRLAELLGDRDDIGF